MTRLLHRDLPPQPQESALMYGYYLRSLGEEFTYFEPTGVMAGRFRGRALVGDGPVALNRVLGRIPGVARLRKLVRPGIRELDRRLRRLP